jgi:hypothetical protein
VEGAEGGSAHGTIGSLPCEYSLFATITFGRVGSTTNVGTGFGGTNAVIRLGVRVGVGVDVVACVGWGASCAAGREHPASPSSRQPASAAARIIS